MFEFHLYLRVLLKISRHTDILISGLGIFGIVFVRTSIQVMIAMLFATASHVLSFALHRVP